METSFDTLTASQRLQETGMSTSQADEITCVIADAVSELVTKDHFDARMESMQIRNDARFAGIDARFTGIDARFTEIEARFTGLEAKIDSQITRLDAKIDLRTGELDAKIDLRTGELDAKIDLRTGELDAKIDLRTAELDANIDQQSAAVKMEIRERFGELAAGQWRVALMIVLAQVAVMGLGVAVITYIQTTLFL